MPSVRKMTPDEVAALAQREKEQRHAVEALYDDLLRDCIVGDTVELELDPDERRPTVIARLKAAAIRHTPALTLEFQSSTEPHILTFVVSGSAEPVSGPKYLPPPVPDLPDLDAELDDVEDMRGNRLPSWRNTRPQRSPDRGTPGTGPRYTSQPRNGTGGQGRPGNANRGQGYGRNGTGRNDYSGAQRTDQQRNERSQDSSRGERSERGDRNTGGAAGRQRWRRRPPR